MSPLFEPGVLRPSSSPSAGVAARVVVVVVTVFVVSRVYLGETAGGGKVSYEASRQRVVESAKGDKEKRVGGENVEAYTKKSTAPRATKSLKLPFGCISRLLRNLSDTSPSSPPLKGDTSDMCGSSPSRRNCTK